MITLINERYKPADSLDDLSPPQMHGCFQFLLGSVLERVNDIHVDVETDQEGDAELEGDSGHAETDPRESLPLLSADLTAFVHRELHVEAVGDHQADGAQVDDGDHHDGGCPGPSAPRPGVSHLQRLIPVPGDPKQTQTRHVDCRALGEVMSR